VVSGWNTSVGDAWTYCCSLAVTMGSSLYSRNSSSDRRYCERLTLRADYLRLLELTVSIKVFLVKDSSCLGMYF